MEPIQASFSNSSAVAQENARFMTQVYAWMTAGIITTAVVSSYIAGNPRIAFTILMNKPIFWSLIVLQLGAVIFLSARIQSLSVTAVIALYFGYAALTGTTLSSIFFVYTQESITHVFLVTGGAFAGLSAFGYFTKRDLGPIGSFCAMGLFGLVAFGLLSLLVPSLMTDQASWIYGMVGIVVFSGLTAYDTQKIKNLNIIGNEGTDEDRKEAVHGALVLYLDFINLFLKLLRVMGRRR